MQKVLNKVFLFLFLLLVSVSTFASLVGIPKCITGSAVGLKIFVLTAGIFMIKRKHHDQILLLAKAK